MIKLIFYLIAALSAAYLVICGYMFAAQRSLLYKPDRTALLPETFGLGMADRVRVQSTDGVTVTAWHVPARENMPTIYYMHGNAGDVSGRADRFKAFAEEGYGVFALSYRGYGDSDGAPSESGLFDDAAAGWKYLTHAGVASEKTILYGESLGTGVALHLATESGAEPYFVALEAPYLSISAIAKLSYPWLPVDMLLRDKFDSERRITHLKTPLLIMHGERDGVIPFAHGKALFEKAVSPVKRFRHIPGEGHVDASGETMIGFIKGFEGEL